MLGAIGLTPVEESVYRALLGHSQATTAELTAEVQEAPAQVAAALERLHEYGVIIRTGGDRFAVAPPAVALGALITERRDALRIAELALATFAEQHRTAAAGRTINELIEVVTGVDAIRHRFMQVQRAARTQIRTFIAAPFIAVSPGENPAENAAADRGVRVRVVIERAALAQPGVFTETLVSLRGGTQVRIVDELPMKLIIADSALGLVPLTAQAGAAPGAVLLHQSSLLAALEALFEVFWRHAYPLELSTVDGELPHPGAEPGPDAGAVELAADGPTSLDRRILALLLAGLTDQAVVAQLDISLRSLQRRLRYLMDLAGVDTRMQLGWHAARHHWA